MDQDTERYINQLEADLQVKDTENKKMYASQQNLFNQMPSEDNLIRWQLDLKEDMERIYHLLKGDIAIETENATLFQKPNDPRLILFNDFGVQLIMNIMSFYLNRNTLLSNFDDETIKWKVYDFGLAVSDLILVRYEEMFYVPTFNECKEMILRNIKEKRDQAQGVYKDLYGINLSEQQLDEFILEDNVMNVYENFLKEVKKIQKEILFQKLKMYDIIVLELVDNVHAALLRALDGGERESLRTGRMVTESYNRTPNQMNNNGPSMNSGKVSLLKPWTWGKK